MTSSGSESPAKLACQRADEDQEREVKAYGRFRRALDTDHHCDDGRLSSAILRIKEEIGESLGGAKHALWFLSDARANDDLLGLGADDAVAEHFAILVLGMAKTTYDRSWRRPFIHKRLAPLLESAPAAETLRARLYIARSGVISNAQRGGNRFGLHG